MPHVDITVIGKAPNAEQKAALFKGVTDLMVDVLGRARKSVVVSIAPGEPSNWSVAGDPQSRDAVLGLQVVLKVLAGTGSDEQKAAMVKQTTDLLTKVLGKPTMPLYMTFEEVPSAQWGFDGRTVAEIAKHPQAT